MIIDTHTHVVCGDKVRYLLDSGARKWSVKISNGVSPSAQKWPYSDGMELTHPKATASSTEIRWKCKGYIV